MRLFIGGLVFFIFFILINSACKDENAVGVEFHSSSIPSSAVNQVELNIVGTWYNQGGRETLLKNFVRKYNFTNQDVNVVITFNDNIPGYLQDITKTLKTQIQAPFSQWDVLLLNNNYSIIIDGEPNWAKKYFVDFSQFEEFKQHTIPGLVTDSVKNVWGGIIPGPFVEGFSYSIWCNNNVAAKIGVNVKQVDMTFDDFKSYIKATHKYNKENPDDFIIPILEAGGDWRTMGKFFEQLYSSKLNDKTAYFNDYTSEKKLNAWHETLKALEELSVFEPLCDKWDTMTWSNNVDLMLDEKCLFHANGSWMYNQWQSSGGEKINNLMPVELPVFNTACSYPAGYQVVWGVPKNAKNKDEAIKFLLALNCSDFAEQWTRKTKCPTGIKGNLATVSLGKDQFENFIYTINEKYGNNTFVALGNQTIFGYANKDNNNYAYEVLLGEMTANQAIREIRNTLLGQNVTIINN